MPTPSQLYGGELVDLQVRYWIDDNGLMEAEATIPNGKPKGDTVLSVKFRRYYWNGGFSDVIAELNASGKSHEGLRRQVVAAITEWDLKSDDGKPVDLTVAALSDQPSQFLTATLHACEVACGPSKRVGGEDSGVSGD